MSNVNLSVDPGTLREFSGKYGNYAQTLVDTHTNLFNDAKVLANEWIGPASESFYSQIESLMPYLQQASDLAATYSKQLAQAADLYDSNETEMAAKFSV